MISRPYRLTQAAERHLSEILGTGEDLWGPDARDRYQALIEQAINDLADNPRRLGVQCQTARNRDPVSAPNRDPFRVGLCR